MNSAAAEAIARAWHPVGCKYKQDQYETCRYRAQHEHTGRNAVNRLREAGWELCQASPPEAETIPMFGETHQKERQSW